MDTPDRPYLDIQIRPNATSGPRKPSRRSPAGSAPRKPPATGTPSAATPPPRKSTGTRSSPSSTTHSPATPGYRQFRPTPELRPKPVTHRYPYVARAPECLRSKRVGRPKSLGLYKAVEAACMYLRQNAAQEFIGDVRDTSQPTISRYLAVLVPLVKSVLGEFVPSAAVAIEVVKGRVVLVDGTLTPCWSYEKHQE